MSEEEFRKMQLLQLEMIAEVDRVCRKHNISYIIGFGTLIGAIRHQGYIPWDDDADICMLREEYEKFKKVTYELNPNICYFQDHDTDPEYLWQHGKLRRINTVYIREGQEHLHCKTGVFIDVFPMDDVPVGVCGAVLQNIECYCLRKILWSRVAKCSEKGFWKYWYKVVSCIPVRLVYKRLKHYTDKSKNSTPNRVRMLLFPASGTVYRHGHALNERYGLEKKWFLERCEYQFETLKVFGSKDYHNHLTFIYGNYMQLPPVEQRQQHAPVSEYEF